MNIRVCIIDERTVIVCMGLRQGLYVNQWPAFVKYRKKK